MNKQNTRTDDYLTRRKHLETLSNQELKERFWMLADKATKPLIDLAYKHTTPAIERSVLLRMGFSSIEAQKIVTNVVQHNLIGKGAGHVVYRYSTLHHISIRDAGLALMDNTGFDEVIQSFEVTK